MGLLEQGLEGLFPSNIYCLSCGSIIDQSRPYALCDHCMPLFHWVGDHTCRQCGKLLSETYASDFCYDCRTYDHTFDQGFTCTQYGMYERELMMDYKYRGKAYIGKKLGDILFDRISLEHVEADYIVPVPIHKKRLRQRGYNQAALMAKRLAEQMKVTCAQNLLERTRYTSAMRGLSAFERQENLKEVFAVSEASCYNIEEKKILLVDDIYTTGSTMDACSTVLKEAGVRQVFALSFAAGANMRPAQ